jgi:hypothetical protein
MPRFITRRAALITGLQTIAGGLAGTALALPPQPQLAGLPNTLTAIIGGIPGLNGMYTLTRGNGQGWGVEFPWGFHTVHGLTLVVGTSNDPRGGASGSAHLRLTLDTAVPLNAWVGIAGLEPTFWNVAMSGGPGGGASAVVRA